MISLMCYKEFSPDGENYQSMRDFFESGPYEGQEKIAYYLDNGTKTYVRASRGTDPFTGENISGQYTGMTDGEYSWSSVLSYYVRRYNLRLPRGVRRKSIQKDKITTINNESE